MGQLDDYSAFKLYIAIKLHFTNASYDLKIYNGRLNCNLESFKERNDMLLFKKLSKRYSKVEFIRYIASNMMYGNFNVIYDDEVAERVYKHYLKVRDSSTRVFEEDLLTLFKMGVKVPSSEFSKESFKSAMSGRITIESFSILDDLYSILDELKENSQISLMFSEDMLRLSRVKMFVKYDLENIQRVLNRCL
jgi:hypothetical protein